VLSVPLWLTEGFAPVNTYEILVDAKLPVGCSVGEGLRCPAGAQRAAPLRNGVTE
jgi:hypothetical protein